MAICERYPELPPSGARYSNIVPHLTVVQVADDRQFDRIAGEFARGAQGKLPIRATVREISLMTGREGIWVVHTNFALGEGV